MVMVRDSLSKICTVPDCSHHQFTKYCCFRSDLDHVLRRKEGCLKKCAASVVIVCTLLSPHPPSLHLQMFQMIIMKCTKGSNKKIAIF